MVPPDNTPDSTKDDHVENQGGSDSKKPTRPTPEQGLKCPRCDSPNTKFCYYNNYSLTQPRHFCKTCRRYWTNGGALRNVPIGGGCRKNKKVKTSSSSSTSSLSRLSCDSNKDSASSSSELAAGLRFFQLGGLPFPPRLHHHQPSFSTGIYNQFSSFGDVSASATGASVTRSASSFQLDPPGGTPDSLIGLNYPFSSSTGSGLINGAIQGMNSMNVNSSTLASSIESLSTINQDLHWKLQQHRLAMMFGGGDNNLQKDKDSSSSSVSLSHQVINLEKPQPILFQNLQISKPDEMLQAGINHSRKEGSSGNAPIECFFGNSYSSVMTPATTTSSVGNGYDNANNNWDSGVHAWGDVQQQPYSALP